MELLDLKTFHDELVERYAALGLYRKEDDGRESILRAVTVEPVTGESPERIAELRAMAIAQGVPVERANAEDFGDRVLTFTASDETVDRYGDKILVDGTLELPEEFGGKRKFGKGWQLRDYKKNPVFLAGHNHRDIPIGMALDTWTDAVVTGKGERKRLRQSVLMDDGSSNPTAPFYTKAYHNRVLRSVSVGFWPQKFYRPATDEERAAIGLGKWGFLFGEQDLWENSAVSVPANPNARLEKGYNAEALRRFADELADVDPETAYEIRQDFHRLTLVLDMAPSPAAAPAEITTAGGANAPAVDSADDEGVRVEREAGEGEAAGLGALFGRLERLVGELEDVALEVRESARGSRPSGQTDSHEAAAPYTDVLAVMHETSERLATKERTGRETR